MAPALGRTFVGSKHAIISSSLPGGRGEGGFGGSKCMEPRSRGHNSGTQYGAELLVCWFFLWWLNGLSKD